MEVATQEDLRRLFAEFMMYSIENNMVCAYMNADEIFKMVDQMGVPLELLIKRFHELKAVHFPWMGYARRRWQSGKNPSSILAEIRDSLSANKGFENFGHVKSELKQMFTEQDCKELYENK